MSFKLKCFRLLLSIGMLFDKLNVHTIVMKKDKLILFNLKEMGVQLWSYPIVYIYLHYIALMRINEHRHYLIASIYKFICILKRFYDKADGIDYSVSIPPDRILVFYNSLIIKKIPLNIAMVTTTNRPIW